MDYLPSIITLCAVLFAVFYVWAKFKLLYWQRNGVPTLPANLFFGNLKNSILFRESPGYLLGRLHNQVGDEPLLGVYIFQKPFLLVRDPQIIKQILIKDFNVFANRYFAIRRPEDKIGTDNLFSIDNPEWKYLRTKLSPAFSSSKLKQLFHLVIERSDCLKKFLDDKFQNDLQKIESIDVKEISRMYTTDVIASVAFGVDNNSFVHPQPEFYRRSNEEAEPTISGAIGMFFAFFFPSLVRFTNFSFFYKNGGFFRNVFWASMDAREKSHSERGDLIDSLRKLKNEEQNSTFKFEGDSLVAQSTIFFIAGLESSMTTMSFALWELAKQPELQDKVRAEIRERITDKLQYNAVMDMKYLIQVINETLRLYPPAPIIDRVASQDYRIPDTDVVIEKGTAVYVALPGIQKDPRFYPNPEVFDPDRFSDDRKDEIPPFTFMPFGEGPRICIGSRVGMLQTAVGLLRVLQDYEVSVNPKYTATVSTRSVFTTPASGVHLLFKKINH